MQTKKLKYFGHIIRQNGDTLHRTLLDRKANGLRGRGRPRATWTTNIMKWTGLDYEQAVRLVQDHQKMENRCIQPSPRGRNLMMMMKLDVRERKKQERRWSHCCTVQAKSGREKPGLMRRIFNSETSSRAVSIAIPSILQSSALLTGLAVTCRKSETRNMSIILFSFC